MTPDFEIGETSSLLNGNKKKSEFLQPKNIYSPLKSIAACAGLLTVGVFVFSVYHNIAFPSSNTLLSSSITTSFKACIDESHVGSSLEVDAEQGCTYLFSSSSSSHTSGKSTEKANMVKLCSCQSGAPTLLSHSSLEAYGIVGDGSSRLHTIATGSGTYVTLYEGSSFEGKSLEVGSNSEKRLNRYEDGDGKSWENRVMSISFRSDRGVCDKMAKCSAEEKSLKLTKSAIQAQSVKFKAVVSRSKMNLQASMDYSSIQLHDDPGFLSCSFNWLVPFDGHLPIDTNNPVIYTHLIF